VHGSRSPNGTGHSKKLFLFDDRYDFSYLSATYWPELPSARTLLSKLKGTQRRDIARRALEERAS